MASKRQNTEKLQTDNEKKSKSKANDSLNNPSQDVESLLKQLKAFKNSSSDGTKADYQYPKDVLKALIRELLSSVTSTSRDIAKFSTVLCNDDVLYFSWLTVAELLPKRRPTDICAANCMQLLGKMKLRKETRSKVAGMKTKPAVLQEDAEQKRLWAVEDGPRFHFKMGVVQKCVSLIWQRLQGWGLGGELHRRLLLLLLESLLPQLPNKLQLTDYFMDSMDVDTDNTGGISMLALQGVLLLMQEHHLQYPLVYHKLYSMLQPRVFHSQHKSRLFYLTDLFLSSTHLPEALVAGYVKRLCRLALVSPPTDTVSLLALITNLLVRHPLLRAQMTNKHTRGETKPINCDPYLPEEADPALSRALDSCLWEVLALKRHALPSVSEAANKLLNLTNKALEIPMADVLDQTTQQLFNDEVDKSYKQVFLTFSRPESLSLRSGECVSQHWQLTTPC